jgi:hypothetical protein
METEDVDLETTREVIANSDVHAIHHSIKSRSSIWRGEP